MKALYKLTFISLLITVLSGCSLFSSNDQLNYKPKKLTPLLKQTISFKKIWSKHIGVGTQNTLIKLTPAIAGEVIYTAGEKGTISALNTKTGSLIWRYKIPHIDIGSGLALLNNLVIVTGQRGEVIALNKDNGHPMWSIQLNSTISATPGAAANIIIIKSIDDTLTALDAKTGRVLWTQTILQPALTLQGSSAPVIVNDHAVVAGFANGTLQAFQLDTGALLWNNTVSVPTGRTELERMIDINGTPLIINNMLFANSYQGNIASIDLFSGKTQWSKKFSGYLGLASGFGSVYAVNTKSDLDAFDLETGVIAWQQKKLEYRQLTTPATFSSYILAGDYQGYLHILSQVDGSLAGRIKVSDDAIDTQPLISNQNIYILDTSGQLTALVQE